MGLVPKPTRFEESPKGLATPGYIGTKTAYPDTIFTRLRMIAFLRGHGFTLRQIAISARGTPFEVREPEVVSSGTDDRFPSWA